jgi:hypothetical protein
VHGNEYLYETAATVSFNVVINEKVTSNQGTTSCLQMLEKMRHFELLNCIEINDRVICCLLGDAVIS